LLATSGSRIVNVSSLAARNGQIDIASFRNPVNYQPWKAYGQSKLANLMFTLELNRRLPEGKTIAVAAHPGGASTNLGRNVEGNAVLRFIADKVLLPLLPTADQNARPQLYAAVGEAVGPDHYYGPGKWGEIAGPPRRVELPRSIGQPADWSALWVASEELTGGSFLSQTVVGRGEAARLSA
jgi:NAD(P)-dependent dehydrogenase (short-subunit alcohol dehydrogenase family)